jgi:protease-4
MAMLVLGLSQAAARIAVVEIEGAIGASVKPADYGRLFRALQENHHIRAVVLDIDSPGGSATASDFLYQSLRALAVRKPVVAFIRGTGASGAYLLSCAAVKIVAIPSAIVGSIGVISVRPLLYEAMRRTGLRVSVTKSSELKDMGSMFRPPTKEEQAKEQELIDELYENFVDVVAQGRRLDKEAVKKLATGEIYTAQKGRSLGLVDEIGDLERAIDIAAELGNTARRPTWMKPRRGLRDLIGSLVVTSLVEPIVTRVEERLRAPVSFDYR